METRTVQQVKIYKLVLNPVSGRYEESQIVAISLNRESLVDLYEGHRVEVYEDRSHDRLYRKSFAKGSILEWFNPVYDIHLLDNYGRGIQEEWIDMEIYDRVVANGDYIIVE